MTATWTIMIATLGRRREKLARLLGGLLPQVDAAAGQVTVEALWNNGERPIGQVREDLMRHTDATYINFIDDDDEVPPYYVDRVLPLLDGVDYIGWRATLWQDGVQAPPVCHSLRYNGWFTDHTGQFCRDLTHFNPIRRDLAVTSSFLGDHEAYGEDYDWTRGLRGKVLTEHFIDEVMYYQRYDGTDTVAVHGGFDAGTYERLEVASPYFTWVEGPPWT